MVWLNVILNVLGIGRDALNNRAERKRLEATQGHEIIKAQTEAVVDRIKNNTHSDNEIDLITARNKRYTWKDEVVSYLFLVPVFVAAIVPFIIAYQNNDWINLNAHVQESYRSLDLLPDWYKVIVILIIIDILGFRSFARKVIENWSNKKSNKINKM